MSLFKNPMWNENDLETTALRHHIEFNALPNLLYEEKELTLASLQGGLGAMMLEFLYHKYSQSKPAPYKATDFRVEDTTTLGGMKCLVIHMPERGLAFTLCRRVYILWNDGDSLVRYFTVEMGMQNDMLCYVDRQGGHGNYGPVTAADERERIAEIVQN